MNYKYSIIIEYVKYYKYYKNSNLSQTLLIIYTLEDLKCRFYSTKNIQGLPVAESVNYDFVKASTLTDLLTFF